MIDVNLNSPDLKLVSTSAQAPAQALSSSQAGGNAPDLAAAPAIRPTVQTTVAQQVSQAEKADARNKEHGADLGEAVTQLNDFVQSVQRDLQFEVDNEMGKTIVRVIDQETQQVIRQIPDEVALRLAENLQQDEPLTLFDITV